MPKAKDTDIPIAYLRECFDLWPLTGALTLAQEATRAFRRRASLATMERYVRRKFRRPPSPPRPRSCASDDRRQTTELHGASHCLGAVDGSLAGGRDRPSERHHERERHGQLARSYAQPTEPQPEASMRQHVWLHRSHVRSTVPQVARSDHRGRQKAKTSWPLQHSRSRLLCLPRRQGRTSSVSARATRSSRFVIAALVATRQHLALSFRGCVRRACPVRRRWAHGGDQHEARREPRGRPPPGSGLAFRAACERPRRARRAARPESSSSL